MKNDLISRSALLEAIAAAFFKTDPTGEEQLGYLACNRIVREFPGIDAEPVKHGIWEEDPYYVWRCSECHKWLMVEQGDSSMNFCTHCGARMDGRVEG